jgi:hypothetical protein
MPKMIEGIHYYINDAGWVVLTQKYLLERGYCCGNGCLHCPYNYEQVAEPTRSELLKKRDRGLTDKR